jgi:predicted CoA-binding protein
LNQEEQILDTYRIVAVVGLSPDAERASFRVASYLKEQGYRIIPVNPKLSQILGEVCYPELTSIREPVEVVDIFRRAEEAPGIVDQAIAIGARVIWMQEGIVNEAAAQKAREAGLLVVMDRCLRKEHLKATEKKKSGGE